MNKLMMLPMVLLTVLAITQAGCNSSTKKLENAQENAKDANEELTEAETNYLEDMKLYKEENDARIAANQKSIDDFKARIKADKKEATAEYRKKIADLETKNTDMKKKLDDYKEEGSENWKKFKEEFSKDMSELGTAFKDFTTTDNKKE